MLNGRFRFGSLRFSGTRPNLLFELAGGTSFTIGRRETSDLVLEGGGVKGIGLVGAVLTLYDAGFVFPRIAGTSADRAQQ